MLDPSRRDELHCFVNGVAAHNFGDLSKQLQRNCLGNLPATGVNNIQDNLHRFWVIKLLSLNKQLPVASGPFRVPGEKGLESWRRPDEVMRRESEGCALTFRGVAFLSFPSVFPFHSFRRPGLRGGGFMGHAGALLGFWRGQLLFLRIQKPFQGEDYIPTRI